MSGTGAIVVDNGVGAGSGAGEVSVDWVQVIMRLLGGMALFLFGMSNLGKCLREAFGASLKQVLAKFCVNRFAGFATGTVATALLSSSTAASVLVVSFVEAGHMSFQDALGVCLGVNVGSTLTAHLVAFKITKYAMILVAAGFFWSLFVSSPESKVHGMTLFSLGILFYGLDVMGDSMSPLRSYQPFVNMLASMENPLLGIVASTIFTIVVQASAATAGIAIVLAQAGFLKLQAGMALILGANIGTCGTACVTAIGKNAATRRVAAVYLFFKIAGVLMWLPALSYMEYVIVALSGDSVAQGIANTHTVFNVFVALVFLPLTGPVTALMYKLIPKDAQELGKAKQ